MQLYNNLTSFFTNSGGIEKQHSIYLYVLILGEQHQSTVFAEVTVREGVINLFS